MMNRPTLFDEQLAMALTQQAINQVEENANQQWMDEALEVVKRLSKTFNLFTTDDVWNWMQYLHPDSETHDNRAMGAVMRKAARGKLCIPTDKYIKSTRTSCHHRPIRVWKGI